MNNNNFYISLFFLGSLAITSCNQDTTETSGESNSGQAVPKMKMTTDLPEGISASIDKKNVIRLTGIDKELLGHTAASIRRLRPPESYKGKGIKYAEERIQRKAGKAGAKAL